MKRYISVAFLCLLLAACSKTNLKPSNLYKKTGIWTITRASVTYSDTTGKVDSSREIASPGFFLFYDMKLSTNPLTYLAQRSYHTGYSSKKEGVWYHTDKDKIYMGTDTLNHTPDRVYTVVIHSKHDETWTFEGDLGTGSQRYHYKEVFDVNDNQY